MPIINNYALDNYLIDGSLTGPLYATGTMARSTNYLTFTSLYYADTKYYITVSGLSFRPNRIIVRLQNLRALTEKLFPFMTLTQEKRHPVHIRNPAVQGLAGIIMSVIKAKMVTHNLTLVLCV